VLTEVSIGLASYCAMLTLSNCWSGGNNRVVMVVSRIVPMLRDLGDGMGVGVTSACYRLCLAVTTEIPVELVKQVVEIVHRHVTVCRFPGRVAAIIVNSCTAVALLSRVFPACVTESYFVECVDALAPLIDKLPPSDDTSAIRAVVRGLITNVRKE
jgi:hypothetical protein